MSAAAPEAAAAQNPPQNSAFSSPFTNFITQIVNVLYTYITFLLTDFVSMSENLMSTIINFITGIFKPLLTFLNKTIFKDLYDQLYNFLNFFLIAPLSILYSGFKSANAPLIESGGYKYFAIIFFIITAMVYFMTKKDAPAAINAPQINPFMFVLTNLVYWIYFVFNAVGKNIMLLLYSALRGLDCLDSIDARNDLFQNKIIGLFIIILIITLSVKYDNLINHIITPILGFVLLVFVFVYNQFYINIDNIGDKDIKNIKRWPLFKNQIYAYTLFNSAEQKPDFIYNLNKTFKLLYHFTPMNFAINPLYEFIKSIFVNFIDFINPENSITDLYEEKYESGYIFSMTFLWICAYIQRFFTEGAGRYIMDLLLMSGLSIMFFVTCLVIFCGFLYYVYSNTYEKQIYDYFTLFYVIVMLPTLYKIFTGVDNTDGTGGGTLYKGIIAFALGMVSLIIMYYSYNFTLKMDDYSPTPEQMTSKTYFDVLFLIYIAFVAFFVNVRLLSSSFDMARLDMFINTYFVFLIAILYYAVSYKVKLRNRIDKAPGEVDTTALQTGANTYVTNAIPVSV